MSSSITILHHLTSFSNSQNYCKQLPLFTKTSHLPQFNPQHEMISNNTVILPPTVWFSIQQNKCYLSIKNDIERSRVTRIGILSTNTKGSLLNRINYQNLQEDVGTMQEIQQAFCVPFAVVKDSCDEFLKLIGSELRSTIIRKTNLISTSHLKISQLDQISKQIYNMYRIFLIFDTKTQPGRTLCFHSCFYPNIQFNIQKIKKKEGFKFSPNQIFQLIQRGQLINNFGFLTLDSKMRLLMIKRDDPGLKDDNVIGIWVVASYPAMRNKKQFGKDDAIWVALLDYYTNPDVRNKLSIIQKNKGFLCYINYKKQRNKLDSPQFYLFEPNTKIQPKWSYAIKNQILSDSNKSCEIKIQFVNSTIVEERQYSEFSDQNVYQERIKNENMNRENFGSNSSTGTKQKEKDKQDREKNIINNRNVKGVGYTGEGLTKSYDISKSKIYQQDQRDKIIKELRVELERYKQKCIQLQAMNKILMQQKMMNPMMYQTHQYPIMNHMNHMNPSYPFNQLTNFAYPLSYSQVSTGNHFPQPQFHQQEVPRQQVIKPTPDQTNINHGVHMTSVSSAIVSQPQTMKQTLKIQQSLPNQIEQAKKSFNYFPEVNQQEMTFGTKNVGNVQQNQQRKTGKSASISSLKITNNNNDKLFLKKSQSHGQQKQEPKKQQKLQKQDKVNNENSKQTYFRKDLRNISFQDSFAQYHSEGEDDAPVFKSTQTNPNIKTFKFGQFQSSKKKAKQIDEDELPMNFTKSPEFKRLHSLQSDSIKVMQYDPTFKKRQLKKQDPQIKSNEILNMENKKLERQQEQIKQKQLLLQYKKSPDSKFQSQKQQPLKKNEKKRVHSSNSQQEVEIDFRAKQNLSSNVNTRPQKQQKPKIIRQQVKKQYKRPIVKGNSSQSEDSDQDIHIKQIRKSYLKR